MANKTPILTEVEADAAWHFSPANRNSFSAAWAHQPRTRTKEGGRECLKIQF